MAEGLEQIPEFLREVLYPTALSSFRESMPSGEIELVLHTSRTEESSITLKNMFPFMTLQDIKLALYIELKRDEAAIPEFIYLANHGPAPGKSFLGGQVAPVDFSWNFPGVSASKPFLNKAPFELAGGPSLDGRFVDANGERKLVSSVERERMTIEDAFIKKSGTIPVLHAYLYKDLLAAIPGAKPPSEKDWNGRLYPYFPYLTPATGGPSAEQKTQVQRLVTVFARRQQFLIRLESLLEGGLPLIPLTLAGVRFLRLTWGKRKEIPGIEAQFYEAGVNERRPFMRLIPTEGSGISKVFLKDGKTPDIHDPKMLVVWSQERNPTPEQDYAFAKILLRKGLFNVVPIYATLRLFNDGSADCIIEPPKGAKKLEPRTDLESLGENIVEGLKDLPYISSQPDIGNAALVLGVKLPKSVAAITQRVIRARLPIFSAFFQEIAALPGEKPLAMLRFKLVSNFATEDRVQTFLTQVINRKVLRGEGLLTDLVELVADEFQMDIADARKQVAKKLQAQGDVVLVTPETKDYMLQYNPGIDVAVFAQHPFYTFHLYRVNSLENLQRVMTALSLLMSAGTEDLQVGEKAVKELQTAEKASATEAEVEAEVEVAAVEPVEPVAAADAVAEAPAETTVLGAEEIDEFIDYFGAFGGDEAQGNAANASVAAAQQEGTPFPEPPLEGKAAPAEPATQAAAAPAQELRREIAATTVAPKEELEGIGVAPIATATATVTQEDDEEAPTTGETGIANYFLTKLKEADSRLFDYTKSHPSLKRYVSKCQPTYGRQPAVLSEEKFQEMQQEYANDDVVFQVYPLEPGEPDRPPGQVEKEYFTVLRYGTSPQKQNYYLCCRYFCTRDEIMVRDVDLESTKMRRPVGASKKAGECPFCRGTIIRSKKSPGPGQTILERPVKPLTKDARHLFIRFLKSTPHPEGFYLPCCFLDESPVRFKDNPAFDKYKDWGLAPKPSTMRPAGSAAAVAAAAADEEEEQERRAAAGPRIESGLPLLDYYVTMASVTKKYIVGAEKLPLEVGTITTGNRGEPQIGLLPAVLDPYFNQDQTQLVSRAFNPQKIKPDGMGFLRIGIENRLRFKNDSFLAAIAPFFLLNSAEQMKDLLLSKITPRVFLAMNYGNLALEFYDPADSIVKRPEDSELAVWAEEELSVSLHEENKEALVRAYVSHTTFQGWLKSDQTKKEFRHFALLLAQSGFMRSGARGGLTIIVLDILKSGKMTVRCPPYGYNAELMSKNDVGFLMHHWSGIWEPIFHVDNRSEERGLDHFTLVFQMANIGQWPPIVLQRQQEFSAQCSSAGRGFYTSQSDMNPLAMIPASVAKRILAKDTKVVLAAVLRDSYNHVGALLYKDRGNMGGGYLPLPVSDDGELITDKELVMDWDDPEFKRAPIEQVLAFYKNYVEPRFALYPGFSPIRVVKSRKSGTIEAMQLRNGLYVPVATMSSEEGKAAMEGSPMVEVDEMEWTINHEICLEEKGSEIPGEKGRMDATNFQEVFEHLRLTFSNWLASKEDGGEFRKVLEGVIFSRKLPLFEKRKRLDILLGREISKWMTTDYTEEDAKRADEASLLRVDCRVRGKEACGGRCVWRQEAATKCMIHAPEETELGESEKKVSAPRVLLLRLIEELLRYGERRRQLLEQDVSRLATLDRPITLGKPGQVGKERIYPEKSAAWYELLRLEWSAKLDENAVYIEEMGREGAAAVAAPLAPQEDSTALPPSLQTVLNGSAEADPKTGALRLLRAPFESIFTPIGLITKQLGIAKDTVAMTDKMIREAVQMTARPFVQIDLRADPPEVIAKKAKRILFPGIPVIVITETGPALLVRNPEEPDMLKKGDLPKGLVDILEKAQSMFIGLKARPPVAAAAVAAAAAPEVVAAPEPEPQPEPQPEPEPAPEPEPEPEPAPEENAFENVNVTEASPEA
jgi:hypothetical protein